MKSSRKAVFWVIFIVILIVAGLYFGYPFARQSAIQHAISRCAAFYGVQVAEPWDIHADLTTYDRAHKLLYGQYPNPIQRSAHDPGPLVWAVEMKGDWILLGGPPPDPTMPPSGPSHIGECKIIIDALTGTTNMEGMVE